MTHVNSKQTPRIWLVIGDKPGDNAQIEIIAEALGLPYEVKRVIPKPDYVLGKPRFKASLYHLDRERSDKLEAPWPDVILTIGRRPSMAALWIQAQSGGHSKIILLGRPKRWMDRFSLVIVPTQYQMPDNAKVLNLDLPLMRSNETAIATAADAWRGRLADLPPPLTALLIGGQTKPFRFDAEAALELLDAAHKAAGHGFLYISTSRRTPPAVIEALKEHLPPNSRLYCWSANSSDNPYLALMGLADRFIVTGDSVSMMVEVARMGKPLAIYALPYQKGFTGRLLRLGKPLNRLGLLRNTRDLTAIHQLLYEKQLAVPLGEDFLTSGKRPADELYRVTDRIREIIPLSP